MKDKPKHRRCSWRGFFTARRLSDGKIVAENEITSDGILMTLELWNADTTERFDRLRLLDYQDQEVATKTATRSYEVDTGGADPLGIFETTALFNSSDLSDAVESVQLLGSEDTVIGEAALSLDADTAYEVKRTDYLGECSEIVPETT